MLPMETSIRQLKRLRAETKGTDIGDLTANDRLNHNVPNLQYIGNPIDSHIDSYEEFAETDSKLQTIAFKSKLVNKPLIKEHKDHEHEKFMTLKCPHCDDTDHYKVISHGKGHISEQSFVCHDCKHKFQKTIKENMENTEIIKFQEFECNNSKKEKKNKKIKTIKEGLDADFDREEVINSICDNSAFAREELEDMNDNELADIYLDLGLADMYLYHQENVKKFEAFNLKEVSPKEEKQPEYEIFGKEKEYKSNPNFGFAAVRDEEIPKIGSFTSFTKLIDPHTPKERPILNAGAFIDNDTVKGYVNRIEGKDVYVESIEEPMVINKFNIKDVVKLKKEKE